MADDNRNIHDLFNGFRRISRPSLGIVHRIKTRAGAFLYALADVKCGNACRLQYLRHLDGLVKLPAARYPFVCRITHDDREFMAAFPLDRRNDFKNETHPVF